MEQFEDAILKVLLLAATVSLVIGIWKDGIEEVCQNTKKCINSIHLGMA